MSYSPSILAISASFTAEPLANGLNWWFERSQCPLRTSFAPYSQVFQQLADPTSLLRTNRGGINLVLLRACDLGVQDETAATRMAKEISASLVEVNQKDGITTIVCACPDANLTLVNARFADELCAQLANVPGIAVMECSELESLYPVAHPFDPEAEKTAHVPYTDEMYAAMATWLARRVLAIRRKPFKVIAVDCDQTLWSGVCGEVGPCGVVIDENRRKFHQFLLEKRSQGFLLCMVTKNNHQDVEAVFRENNEMRISREAFTDAAISWEPKSVGLGSLAKRLNIGLESIIFLDDNPAEIAEVQSHAPAVLAIQVPSDSGDLARFVKHLWVLDSPQITGEDAQRADFYQREIKRNELRESAASFAKFIEELGLEISMEPPTAVEMSRASQLTFRTNQFNASPMPMDEAAMSRASLSDFSALVKVSDRFGDYGAVGLMIGTQQASRLMVDVFLLSCRALGKGVEHRMLRQLGEYALHHRLSEVAIRFQDSGRNQPCKDFLESVADGRWEEHLRVIPAAAAAACVLQAPLQKTETPQREAPARQEDPSWVVRVASEFHDVKAVIEELRGEPQPRPDISEAFAAPRGWHEQAVAEVWQEILELQSVGRNDRFSDLGGTSLQLVRVHGALQRKFGHAIEWVRLFENPTVASQAKLVSGNEQSFQNPNNDAAHGDSSAVAIIGMAVRLPGASTPDELWCNLRDGVESITHFDQSELDVPNANQESLVCARGLLSPDVYEGIDGGLFGIVPREAETIDPQHRVFLEICWEAIERAGYVPDDVEAAGGRTGVYAGCFYDTYLLNHILSDPQTQLHHLAEAQVGALQIEFGNDKDHIATRVAFKLNLHGPSLTVQTACSTSLVAVAHAIMALRSGQCDMALAGGVTITVPQKRGYRHVEGSMLSPDGHCRPFDARSAGTVFSNGGGVVLLKRLDDALRDGDTIHAVLRGFGMNNDGGVKHSYAAPSVNGQADAIRRAHIDAGVEPRSITYIEAHGTATPMGDPIEIAGLTQAFRAHTEEKGFCAIGSLKSNVGHLDTASGVCGLIKTALSLKHGVLPPLLHYSEPNPRIDFANSPFFVNDRLRQWQPAPGSPRRAGVSSFGVGGTNVHLIVEEAPSRPLEARNSKSLDRILLVSARDQAALDALTERITHHAREADDAVFAVAARTLALGRKAMLRRSAVVARDWRDAAEQMAAGNLVSATASADPSGLVWMFPGQGAQHPGMTADLYAAEAGFREDVDRCSEWLMPLLGEDLRNALFAPDRADAAERLKHTVLAQSAIFTVEYALARQWQRWGLKPELMLGHSVGEFAAACLAGVFSLEDGLQIVAARGKLMGEVENGSMLSVRLPAKDLRDKLPPTLDLASENGPSLCVVAGATPDVASFAQRLEAEGVAVRELHTSHAFHSRMMDPVVGRFREVIASVSLSAPQIPILSTVTGRYLSEKDARDPDYWAAHLRRTVLFHQAVDAAAAEKENRIFLEVGPGQSLTTLARQTAGRRAASCLASCEHPASNASDYRRMLTSLAELWCRGVDVNWHAVFADVPQRKVPLPTYPFQRRRAWLPCRLLENSTQIPESPRASELTTAAEAELIAESTAPAKENGLAERVRKVLEDLSGIPAEDMEAESGFLELGFDSLLLTQAARALQNAFGVPITFRDLMQTMPTIGSLVSHLEVSGVVLTNPVASPVVEKSGGVSAKSAPTAEPEPESGVAGPRTRIDRTSTSEELTPIQRKHLDELTRRYNQRTKGSKSLTQKNRKWLADPRTVNGFNRLWKEMVYQIVAQRMKGCRMWDVDGNEYIDMVNGFGPNFLGHAPDFVSDAIREQLATGLEIGPQCEVALEASKLFCEVTGNERVCFLNTGSEAVQAAMRIARTVTGRDKILVFDKDYHGNFDPVLVRSVGSGVKRRTLPLAPGIPASAVQDVIVVPWGKPGTLEMIREVAGELAAVLVEPVQSRQPEWIPVSFVHEVKRLAEENGFLLVFDEVITGLRQGLHGAQDLYNIKPDLATYGKVFGGGALPIGIIAGKAEYMDTFDGGQWQYGDDSFPEKEVTFFAGTFVRLPLAMAACRAVLNHLKDQGPEYWDAIAARATRLTRTVDRMFRDNGIDIRMVNTGSQMYLRIGEGAKYGNLIFYHLREKGVFAMEGLPFYLTAQHTDADVDFVIDAFRRSITELQEGDFFSKPPPCVIDAQGARGPFPLTEPMVEIQLAALMGAEANLSFNEMLQLRLTGPIDETGLLASLQDLVDRHDALRMRIPSMHETEFVIDADAKVAVVKKDLRNQPDPETCLLEIAKEQRETAFDLANGPLFRVVIARLKDELTVLQFAAHHIACDGWSFEVLIRDFIHCYDARKRGRAPHLPPAPSIVERSLREASDTHAGEESLLGWWRDKFATGVTELELPLKSGYGASPQYASSSCEKHLDQESLSRLRKLASGCGVTLNSALMAGFQAFLHRLSGQRDFVIAFPSAGQMDSGEEQLIGHCVNFLPLLASVDPRESFKQLAVKVSGDQFDTIAHGKVTYGRLLRELDIRRAGGRRPLVEYIFNFEPSGDPGSFAGLQSRVETVPARYSNSTLFLNAMLAPDGLLLSCTYNHRYIDPATMESWLAAYCNLLMEAAEDPNRSVDELGLLGEKDRAQIHEWGRGPEVHVSGSVSEAFHKACVKHAERVALAWDDGSWTYAELAMRVTATAAALRAHGVMPGERVAVCLKRGPDAIVALLGVLECGGCYVPMDPDYPESRIVEILLQSKAKVSISHEDAPVEGVVRIDPLHGLSKPTISEPITPRGPDDPAYVIFTSGSTGQPKGVVVAHRGILRLALGADYCHLGPDEVILQGSTLAFDASTFEIFGALLHGGKLVLPPVDPALDVLAYTIRNQGVTTLWLTAGLFELMVEEHMDDLKNVRQLLTGGEAPSIEHLRKAHLALPSTRLINGYGPTENTTFTTCHTITAEDLNQSIVPIGKPISGTNVRVVDTQGRLVPVGVLGELQCSGAGLSLGYLQPSNGSDHAFIEEGSWYRTGDLCRWTAQGRLEFIGRIDRQVKVRGFRIEPGEIETVLAGHPAVRQCKVAVRGAGAAGKRLLAWFCPVDGVSVDRSEIRQWLATRLPSFMLPDALVAVNAMPLNANGKLDLNALPEPHGNSQQHEDAGIPEGPTEIKLAAIWRDILGVDDITRNDEFFELGGNSLAGLRMFARIAKDFGVSLPLATLLQDKTVRDLARSIEAAKITAATTAAELVKPTPSHQKIGHMATVRQGGDLPPVVAIHGGDGGILFYKELAMRLPDDRPFVAIESAHLSTNDKIHVCSIEETASAYILLMRKIRPRGPYLLAGYSFGGLVAYEMAQQLVAAGEEVGFLGLIDTVNPMVPIREYSLPERVGVFWKSQEDKPLLNRFHRLAARFRDGVNTNLRVRAEVAAANSLMAEAHSELRGVQLREAHHQSMLEYQPKPYPGALTLFRASDVNDKFEIPSDYGWQNMVSDLRIINVPGEHLTVFSPEHIDVLANRFASTLPSSKGSLTRQIATEV